MGLDDVGARVTSVGPLNVGEIVVSIETPLGGLDMQSESTLQSHESFTTIAVHPEA